MSLGAEVGVSPRYIVLDGDPLPPPRKMGTAANFRPMSVVAKWLHGSIIKMPLSTDVGLGSGDIVLDGDPAPPKIVAEKNVPEMTTFVSNSSRT